MKLHFGKQLAPAIATMLLLVGQAIAQAPIVDPPTADVVRDAFAKSFEAERKLDYPAAIASLAALGEVPDQSYVINLRLGWLYYSKGDYKAAIPYYEKAASKAPQATEPRVGLLLPLLAAERYEDSIRTAREVLKLDGVNYYAKIRLAYALRMVGQLDEGERICEEMLQLRPTDLTFLAEYGMTLLAKKREADAKEVFNKLLTLDPFNALARQQLGLPASTPPATTPATGTAGSGTDAANTDLSSVFDIPEPDLKFGIMPSIASLDYGKDSIKRNGLANGIYGFISKTNLLEFSADYTHLNFRDGTNLDQQDYTAAYSMFDVEKWKLRVGGRAITSTSPFGNGAWFVFGGLSYYQTGVWDLGVDYYHSHYEDVTFSLDVNQFTPHIAIEHLFTNGLKMRLETLGYLIHLGTDVGLGQQDFFSTETRWRLDGDRVGISAYVWTGRQTFAVRRDGFIVYNLAEEHRGGFGTELTYKASENRLYTLRVTDELFADFSSGLPTHQFVVAGLVTRSF